MTMLATAPVSGGTAWMADAVAATGTQPSSSLPLASALRPPKSAKAEAHSDLSHLPGDVHLPGMGPGEPGVRLLGRGV